MEVIIRVLDYFFVAQAHGNEPDVGEYGFRRSPRTGSRHHYFLPQYLQPPATYRFFSVCIFESANINRKNVKI